MAEISLLNEMLNIDLSIFKRDCLLVLEDEEKIFNLGNTKCQQSNHYVS